MAFYCYILRCSDGSFYTGHTENLEHRIAQPQSGEIPCYTQTRRPVTLTWSQDFPPPSRPPIRRTPDQRLVPRQETGPDRIGLDAP